MIINIFLYKIILLEIKSNDDLVPPSGLHSSLFDMLPLCLQLNNLWLGGKQRETKSSINLISYNHTKGLFFKNKERNANEYYFLSLELWHSVYVNKHMAFSYQSTFLR